MLKNREAYNLGGDNFRSNEQPMRGTLGARGPVSQERLQDLGTGLVGKINN